MSSQCIKNTCGTTQIKFQLRRDTLTRWTELGATLILANGEPSVVTDTGQMKIGDGVTVWSGLPYVGVGSGVMDAFDGGTPSSTYGDLPGIIDAGGVV
jgi:hypothetical protein